MREQARPADPALPNSARQAVPEIKRALQIGQYGRPAVRGQTRERPYLITIVIAKITDDREDLPAFCDFPAGRWIHLRTTNPSLSATPGHVADVHHEGAAAA